MTLFLFLLFNLFAIITWFIFFNQRKWFRQTADKFIASFYLVFLQIIFSELSLGFGFKFLYPIPLILINTVILIVVWLFILKRKKFSIKPVNWIAPLWQEIKHSVLAKILLVLFILEAVWTVYSGWLLPVSEIDSIFYHMPAIAYYFQEHKIYEIAANIHAGQWMNGYPKYIELLGLWQLLWLKSDIYVDLIQFIFALIGILTVYSIGCKLGLKKVYALIAGLIFFFTPVVLAQTRSCYIDLSVAVLALGIANFLLVPLKDKTILGLIFGGITAGLLLGSKSNGMFYVLLLATIILLLFILNNKNLGWPKIIKKLLLHGLLYLAIAFLVGGFWYVKNYAVYRNPIWPIRVNILNHQIFPGLVTFNESIVYTTPKEYKNKPLYYTLFAVWHEKTDGYGYDSRQGGLGAIWFVLAIPSLIALLLYSLKEKNRVFLWLLAIVVIFLLFQPMSWWPRYSLFVAGIGAIATSILYSRQKRCLFNLFSFLIVTGVIYNMLATINFRYMTPDAIHYNLKLKKRCSIARADLPQSLSWRPF